MLHWYNITFYMMESKLVGFDPKQIIDCNCVVVGSYDKNI